MKQTDPQTEAKVLAHIARGDSYDLILEELGRQGEHLTKGTIVNIKQRNLQTLEHMKNTIVLHELNKSTQLLAKSRQLLEKKLGKALLIDEGLEDLKAQLIDGLIDESQFDVLAKNLRKDDLSVAVLTSLSKEMFNQSQLEQNKPTSITENPAEARKNLETLLKAIDDKDERKIIEAIFPDDQPIPAQN